MAALQTDVHAARDQKTFKIPQAHINAPVALPFFLVHAVELGKDHVKRLGQRGDMGDLLAVRAARLLHAEVRVDQQQRFHREVVRLKIPNGMIRGNVADIRQTAPAKPKIGIIIVQIRDPLARTAAKFSDIVARGAAGHQREIDRDAGPLQGLSHRHGDVVNARDVLQRPVGGDLQPQTHHFVNVLALPQPQHLGVACRAGTIVRRRSRKIKVPHRVKGQQLPLGVEQHLKHREQKDRSGAAGGLRALFREEQTAGGVVGAEEPAVPRLVRAELRQLTAA